MAPFKAVSAKRPFQKPAAGAGRPPKPRQRRQRNADGEYDDPDESKPRSHAAPSASGAQKLVFDDDGNTVDAHSNAGRAAQAARRQQDREARGGADDVDTKWFEVYAVHNTSGELVELKEAEQTELNNACRTSFEAELAGLQKSE